MTGNVEAIHPTGDRLAAFALGRLDDGEASSLAEHLGGCETCQEAIRAVPDDSILSLLRPSGSTPLPHPPPQGVTTCEDAAPPELRGHARYQVLRRLGAGGMGVVYQCEHRLMRKTVALKMINKELIAAPGVVERFQREMRAAARLAHPNVVQAFDAEKAGDLHFLVLEFIEGVTLESLVKRDGPLPVDRACDYVRQAALGLAHAVVQGLVHRDVKPQNIMATPDGQVKVMDFGLASIRAEQGGEAGLTEAGQGLGTPDYMAPEQIRDPRTADARADIYSLGGTFYFLLTGRPPFPNGNSAQKMAAHLEQQPEPLSRLRPELPPGLVKVIEKMMAKDPAQRYQTAAAVVAALEPWCQAPAPTCGRPRRRPALQGLLRRPRTVAVAVGVVALILVATALAYFMHGASEPPKSAQPPGPVSPVKAPDHEMQAGDPDPDLSGVTPLMDEDFSDPGKCLFQLVRTETVDARIEDGRYVMQSFSGNGGNRWDCTGPDQAAEGDFACVLEGRVTTAGGHGWALGLGDVTTGQILAIRLRRDGLVEVGNQGDSGLTTTVEPIRPSAFKSGDEFNKLLVVCRGGRKLEIYVNGSAIAPPVLLNQPLLGGIHQYTVMWKRGQDEEGRAEFKRFTLWLLPPPESVVPSKPAAHEVRAGNPSPDLSAATPLIDDDFSAPDNRHFPISRGDVSAEIPDFRIENRRYVMQIPVTPKCPENQWARADSATPVGGDFACQVEGRVTSRGKHGWAMAFGDASAAEFLAVRLRRDGLVEVGRHFLDRCPSTMVGPIRPPAFKSGDEFNKLLVVCRGGRKLEIYVNDQAVGAPVVLDHALGHVLQYLVMWKLGHNIEEGRAEFKRFTLWRLPPPAQAKP